MGSDAGMVGVSKGGDEEERYRRDCYFKICMKDRLGRDKGRDAGKEDA